MKFIAAATKQDVLLLWCDRLCVVSPGGFYQRSYFNYHGKDFWRTLHRDTKLFCHKCAAEEMQRQYNEYSIIQYWTISPHVEHVECSGCGQIIY